VAPLLQPISLTPALEFPSQGPDFRHTFIRRPGIVSKTGYAHYTVRQAAEDRLATGLGGRSPRPSRRTRTSSSRSWRLPAPASSATCRPPTCGRR